jgi:plasmid stability protein
MATGGKPLHRPREASVQHIKEPLDVNFLHVEKRRPDHICVSGPDAPQLAGGFILKVEAKPRIVIANQRARDHIAFNEDAVLKATPMSQLTVRNVSAQLVRTLKQRAAAHGRSAEAEHREILREALLEGEEDFAARATMLRQRLRSTADSSELIRADRDRDTAA